MDREPIKRELYAEQTNALLVVDVQNAFLNPYTSHVPPRIAQLIENARFESIFFTRFVNVAHSPYRRFLGWHACGKSPEIDFAPEIERWAKPDCVFTKKGFTGIPPELEKKLREARLQAITIVGIDTDMCVLKIAMDVFDLGIEPFVRIDCCASTAGLQAHLAGLAVLCRNIGADRLRDGGLGEGRLAAPPEALQEASDAAP